MRRLWVTRKRLRIKFYSEDLNKRDHLMDGNDKICLKEKACNSA